MALATKGLNKKDGFEKFVIYPKYLRWLHEHEEVQKDYDYYHSDEEDYPEKI